MELHTAVKSVCTSRTDLRTDLGMNTSQAKNCVVVLVGGFGHNYIRKDDRGLAVVDTFDLASKLSEQEASSIRAQNPFAVVRPADDYEFELKAKMSTLNEQLRCLPAALAGRLHS